MVESTLARPSALRVSLAQGREYAWRNRASRRRLFQKAKDIGVATAKAAAVMGALGTVDQGVRLARIAGRKYHKAYLRREEADADTIAPGALEDSVDASLFTLDGHFDWLDEVARDPVINMIGHSMITDMMHDPLRFTRLGDTLEAFFETSAHALNEQHPASNLEVDDEEVIHHGLVAAGTVFSVKTNYSVFNIDVNKLGGDDTGTQRWGSSGLMKMAAPMLFPGPRSAGFETHGKDRSMHAIQHALLTYLLSYSEKHKLPNNLQVLPGLVLLSDYGMKIVPSMSTRIFSDFVGWSYEFKTTFSQDYAPRLFGETVEGWGDPEVRHDLAANNLGALCGPILAKGQVREVIEVLNDPRLQTQTTEPRIPTDLLNRLTQLAA
jgi:hypothetical protein